MAGRTMPKEIKNPERETDASEKKRLFFDSSDLSPEEKQKQCQDQQEDSKYLNRAEKSIRERF